MERKKAILVLLAAVWAAIIIYNIYNVRALRTVEGPKSAEERRVRAALPQGVLAIRLDLLEKKHRPYEGVKKDIFSPLISPAPKPAEELPPPPAPEPKPQPPTPLEAFLKDVRFLGFVEKGAEKTIFLGRGVDVFLVKKGDVVDKRFLMVKITSARLTIRDLIKEEEATLELVKEEK